MSAHILPLKWSAILLRTPKMYPRLNAILWIITLVIFSACQQSSLQAQETTQETANPSEASPKKPTAYTIFDTTKSIIFEEDFSKNLKRWVLAINHSGKEAESGKPRVVLSPRIQRIVAPGEHGKYAVRIEMPGAVGDFRSEISLPYEPEIEERWYSERVAIETVPAPDKQGYIFLQFHATQGKDKAPSIRNYPNLALKIQGGRYGVSYAYGDLKNIQHQSEDLGKAAPSMQWVTWVVHAKWSTKEDGLVEIWRDGEPVFRRQGVNLYLLTQDRTPYLQTGIYRPSIKTKTAPEPPSRVYISGVRIGSKKCSFQEITF